MLRILLRAEEYNLKKEGCEVANQIGKRYYCTKCGSEFIVTRAGDGTVTCCGQPMEIKK
jgi:desulfoferrodoxin-like iron-binding protein